MVKLHSQDTIRVRVGARDRVRFRVRVGGALSSLSLLRSFDSFFMRCNVGVYIRVFQGES
jgi:hypothetical protein